MADLSDLNFLPKFVAPPESDVSNQLLERLERFFIVHREIDGVHWTGKKVRIDAVLQPKKELGFFDPSCFLGLEIKRGVDGLGEITKQISQAVDYTNSSFGDFGLMYVFCYPDPIDGGWNQQVNFYDRFIGQLGIGFLSSKSGLRLRLKGHNLWSEAAGAQDAKHWSLKRKFGSK
jgi:hypothetical protein